MTIFKKGDRVKIDYEKKVKDDEEFSSPENLELNPHLLAFGKFIELNKNPMTQKVTDHLKNGESVTITSMSYASKWGWDGQADIKFDDGFETSIRGEYLISTKKKRTKREHYDVGEYVMTKYNMREDDNKIFKILSKSVSTDHSDYNHDFFTKFRNVDILTVDFVEQVLSEKGVSIERHTYYYTVNPKGVEFRLKFDNIKRVLNKKEIKEFESNN